MPDTLILDRIAVENEMSEHLRRDELEEYDWETAGFTPDLLRAELDQYRSQQFVGQVEHAYENTDFYRQLFDYNDLSPDDIESLEDITKIPPTTSDDLANAAVEFPEYPFLAAGWSEVERLNESSGTGGGPSKQQFMSHEDQQRTGEEQARMYDELGLGDKTVFLSAFPYGLNTSGFSAHEGISAIDGFEISAGVMAPPEKHVQLVQKYEPDVLWALPSYAARFTNVLEKEGIDPAETALEYVMVGGEAFTDAQRRFLEHVYDAQTVQVYGLTEVGGMTGAEFKVGNGMHILEDSFIIEIVDSETYEPVPDGESGEVLLTTLRREATPLLRYAPGDRSRFRTDEDRLDSVFKRIDTPWRSKHITHIEGVGIYPTKIGEQIFDVSHEDIERYGFNEEFQIELDFDATEHKHYMTIRVEAKVLDESLESAMERSLGQLLEFESIQQQDVADISVETVPIGSLQTKGKAERLVDHRDNDLERLR